MSDELLPPAGPTGPRGLSAELAAADARVTALLDASVAANTRRAYASDWKMFTRWCARHGVAALPAAAADVARYVAQLSDGTAFPGERAAPRARKPATVRRHLATISVAHRTAGHASPLDAELVRRALEGYERTAGTRPDKKAPAVVDVLRALVDAARATTRLVPGRGVDPATAALLTARNTCVVLLGFGGALRRSEVVGLDDADVAEQPEGLLVTLRWSKTDQRGAGRLVRVARGVDPRYCPARALAAWRAARTRPGADDPLFYSLSRRNRGARLDGRAVARVMHALAGAAGLEAARYAGHSLRSGHVTAAARAGKRLEDIQATTGHQHLETLLEYLERDANWDAVSGRGLL